MRSMKTLPTALLRPCAKPQTTPRLVRSCGAGVGWVGLTGAGERVFCAGVDLKNPNDLSRDDLGESRRQRVTRSLEAVVAFEKPLVTALNGTAIGAGGIVPFLPAL